ncbi:DUF2508 family protein [Pseudoflavonifractor sp. 524-17]|uniref:DUF2508 family protein n=1 Tax=Pseudoflavonifractor sp. 524-17 TaxID=2304577 RepID=UPI00137B094D|nr:DUF2508 family protein [Pseudoflavonifractor sp. 524-17]NCE65249.1 DUF2508 family protein [Pseudoflavonifractor sp. 524-17]
MSRADRRRRQETEEVRRTLREELDRARVDLAQAYANFNGTGDPDLIESYIYTINAIQARYAYLLRQVKTLEAPDSQEAPRREKKGGFRPLSAYP